MITPRKHRFKSYDIRCHYDPFNTGAFAFRLWLPIVRWIKVKPINRAYGGLARKLQPGFARIIRPRKQSSWKVILVFTNKPRPEDREKGRPMLGDELWERVRQLKLEGMACARAC